MEYPNWFISSAQNNFEMYLAEFADKPNLRFLQLGVFNGDASAWMLDNILTDPTSKLVDVDTWSGSPEEGVHNLMNFEKVWKNYLDKVKDYDNVSHFRTDTNHFFNAWDSNENWWFDFIYIDANHTASNVIDDAILSWQHLNSGGIMAFDDYIWHHPDGDLFTPKPSINFFLWVKQGQLELMEANNQVWIRKI